MKLSDIEDKVLFRSFTHPIHDPSYKLGDLVGQAILLYWVKDVETAEKITPGGRHTLHPKGVCMGYYNTAVVPEKATTTQKVKAVKEAVKNLLEGIQDEDIVEKITGFVKTPVYLHLLYVKDYIKELEDDNNSN